MSRLQVKLSIRLEIVPNDFCSDFKVQILNFGTDWLANISI